MGEKKAISDFRIELGSKITSQSSRNSVRSTEDWFPLGTEQQFVDRFIANYAKRIGERNANFALKPPYMKVLFDVVRQEWVNIPQLIAVVKAQLDNIKNTSAKDADGLYIIERDGEELDLLENVIKHHPDDWDKIPLLNEYVDVMMTSRQVSWQ